jgi:hypothetical protein
MSIVESVVSRVICWVQVFDAKRSERDTRVTYCPDFTQEGTLNVIT